MDITTPQFDWQFILINFARGITVAWFLGVLLSLIIPYNRKKTLPSALPNTERKLLYFAAVYPILSLAICLLFTALGIDPSSADKPLGFMFIFCCIHVLLCAMAFAFIRYLFIHKGLRALFILLNCFVAGAYFTGIAYYVHLYNHPMTGYEQVIYR